MYVLYRMIVELEWGTYFHIEQNICNAISHFILQNDV